MLDELERKKSWERYSLDTDYGKHSPHPQKPEVLSEGPILFGDTSTLAGCMTHQRTPGFNTANLVNLFSSIHLWSSASGSSLFFSFWRNPINYNATMQIKVGKICLNDSYPLLSLPWGPHAPSTCQRPSHQSCPYAQPLLSPSASSRLTCPLSCTSRPRLVTATKGQWRNVTSPQIQHNIGLTSHAGLALCKLWMCDDNTDE